MINILVGFITFRGSYEVPVGIDPTVHQVIVTTISIYKNSLHMHTHQMHKCKYNFDVSSAISFVLHADMQFSFLASNLTNMFGVCSGPRLRTCSNKCTKYTDPEALVHYCDLFYLVKK